MKTKAQHAFESYCLKACLLVACDDENKADKLRDEMDPLWFEMTAEFRELSGKMIEQYKLDYEARTARHNKETP